MKKMLKHAQRGAAGIALCAGLMLSATAAADLDMTIQPVLSEQETVQIYQPLADYIGKVMGQKVVIKTSRDFSEYWVTQKDNNPFEVIVDNAFFTDFRNEREGWVSLVKLPGLISYSLVASAANPVYETSELVGKKIASLIPPAPSGIFLGQMFRNPLRQPAIVPTTSAKDALKLLLDGKVDAAIIPTPMANEAMTNGEDLLVIKTSVQIPHSALSVSPKVDEAMREKLTKALLEADQDKQGQAVLKSLNISNFEPADPSLYSGLMQYLIDFSFAN
jgi:ABC-type phosphate/phosphonate transport system substrate-binding protein